MSFANIVGLMAIAATCLLTGAGSLWYLASRLATLATELRGLGDHLTKIGSELRESRDAHQEYSAAMGELTHSLDRRLALLEMQSYGAPRGPRKGAT